MRRAIGLLVVLSFWAIGCAGVPKKEGARADLRAEAEETLAKMEAKDPSLRSVLDESVAYIVFPAVKQGGLLVGGGSGTGVVYEKGQPTAFAYVHQVAFGAVAGGAKFAQVIAIKDPAVFERMKKGDHDFGGSASAVMVRSGAATAATFQGGVAVFREALGGAMVNASVAGQKIKVVF